MFLSVLMAARSSTVNAAEAVPAADNSIPKAFRSTNTTTTTKKIKLKKKAKKTRTEKKELSRKRRTTVKISQGEKTSVMTDVRTQAADKFQKGSRIKIRRTTKTVVTTTLVWQIAGAAGARSVQIKAAAPKADSRVTDAFDALGFTVNVDPGVSYGGCCNVKEKSITLQREGDTIYHELGHFLAFVAGNVDRSSEFQRIFEQEKARQADGENKYAFQDRSEYFAESFRLYTLDPEFLKGNRPLTFAAVEEALGKVTKEQVERVRIIYRPMWEMKESQIETLEPDAADESGALL